MGAHLINFRLLKSSVIQKVIAFLIFIFSVIYIFAPFENDKFTYQWIPQVQGNEVRLTLIEKEPTRFNLTFPCSLFDNDPDWILEAKGGRALQIGLSRNSFLLTLGNKEADQVDQIIIKNIDTECTKINFLFESKNRNLQLKTETFEANQIVPENLAFEIASYLEWNPNISSRGVTLEVTTQPKLLAKPSNFKAILIIIFSIIIIGAFLIFVLLNRKIIRIRLYPNEIYTIFYLLFLGLVIYPMNDDGLYLLAAKVFDQTSILTQYQYPVPFPVGYLHVVINTIFLQELPSLFLLRLIPLTTAFLVWVIFYRVWIKNNKSINKKDFIVLWSIWAVFTAAFFVTLRAEVYVAFFFILALTFVRKYQKTNPELVIYLTIPLAVLSVAFHQSGIVVPFALLPIWIANLFQINWKNIDYLTLAISFVISSFVLFINSNPLLLIQKVKDFEEVLNWSQPFPGEFDWGYPPWYEFVRLKHISVATPLQVLSILIFFVILSFLVVQVLKILKIIDTFKFNELAVVLAVTAAPLGLFFAPSKWYGHYSPLLVTTLIGVVYLLNFGISREKIYFSLSIVAALTITRPWAAGGNSGYSFDLDSKFVAVIYYLLVENRINLYLFLIFIISIAYLTLTKRFFGLSTILVVIILLSIIKQVFPTTIDSAIGSAGWTMNRQITAGIIDENIRCGLFDKVNKDRLANFDIHYQDKFLLSNDYINSPCFEPVDFSQGIWEYPDYVVGEVPVWDQQRLAFKSKIDLVHCFEPINRTYKSDLETCIYSWESEIPQMNLLN